MKYVKGVTNRKCIKTLLQEIKQAWPFYREVRGQGLASNGAGADGVVGTVARECRCRAESLNPGRIQIVATRGPSRSAFMQQAAQSLIKQHPPPQRFIYFYLDCRRMYYVSRLQPAHVSIL